MTKEQKSTELQRYRAVLLAASDYLESTDSSFVFDNSNTIADCYQYQRAQIEIYFTQRRLDQLQKWLTRLTNGPRMSVDLNFSTYIKEKTGYEIDIFKDLQQRVDEFVSNGKLYDDKQVEDVQTLLRLYEKTSSGKAEIEKLRTLLVDYCSQKKIETKNNNVFGVIRRTQKDGLEQITVDSFLGPGPRHFKEDEVMSPNGKFRLAVTQWGTNKSSSTYVTVGIASATGVVYSINGIQPALKARWKDNSTIVVETSKEYEVTIQHKMIRSLEQIITIEYTEF